MNTNIKTKPVQFLYKFLFSGAVSFLTRILSGVLLDRIEFNILMPLVSLLLTIVLVAIYFIGQYSFIGLMISVWLIFALGLSNIPVIPAQVRH